jgi:Transcriptional regulator
MSQEKNGRKIRANGARTRRRLLESAVALWSEHGLLGVTVSAVADKAGTTRRTVYHHFATLNVLLSEASQFVTEQLAALAGGEADDLDEPYGFVAGIAVDNPELVRSVVLDLLRDDPASNPLFARARAFFNGRADAGDLKAGVPGDHAAAITLAMWVAAVLAVSLERDPRLRRKQAEMFASSYKTLLEQGIWTPRNAA